MTTENDYTLLPPNASPLERALEVALRPAGDALAAVPMVAQGKELLPEGWPMFLVWEYGLEELLPYLSDPRAIVTTGLQWQRIKGTPASLRMALGWLGLNAQIQQEHPDHGHWYEYQIDPGKIPTREEMRNIVGLARLSAPEGTRLARLFHGWDFRGAVYDSAIWDSGETYDGAAGIWDEELQVFLSFASRWQFVGILNSRGLHAANLAFFFVSALESVGASAVNFVAVSAGALEIPRQPDGAVITRPRILEEYGWATEKWAARKWGEPADFSE